MHQTTHGTAKHVSRCLQLAILLEVSAEKPGNVNRTESFRNTRYEHFLASAVAANQGLAKATQRGIMVAEGKIELKSIGIGEIVKEIEENINSWQHGGNTLLGTILLLTPMAVAAGMTLITHKKRFSVTKLREDMKLVVKSTTPQDAVAVYEAINVANPDGLSKKAPILDVNDPNSKKKILDENITLYDVFKISSSYDSIASEWVKNYPITFESGLPYFTKQLKDTGNLNIAIVHTFLKILSETPDTLIARKAGLEKAKEVSRRAEEVLRLGGLASSAGRAELSTFDKELRGPANQYNPGTTADIIAAVLAISILNGYRP
ncbi:MAG: triphosphoribosyl-dephospho-CoA synthase [Candidatus Bathyarchaeota archaeon]|nr:MAG: triphosphoribosyl-dephospho-CoA synthase [Candidatus Bathyarchaeota archaeon]